MKRTLLAASAVAVLMLAGCTNSERPSTGATAPTGAPASAPAAVATSAVPSPAGPGGVPALSGTPTDVTKQSAAAAGTGEPPTELLIKDVVKGRGTAATLADTVNVRYTGTLYADGTEFDSSWKRGAAPATFPLDGVVPGFAQGIEGMQPGGRRTIVIPPALGYGNSARGPIPGGSTLVFVVDLVSIG